MKAQRSIYILLTVLVLLLSACQPAAQQTSSEPTQPPAQPSTQPQPQPTDTPEMMITETPTEPSGQVLDGITLDFSGLAENVSIEIVPAQPANADIPYWETLPEYRRLTLEGYPVTDHLHTPQIFIYPVAGLAPVNEYAGKAAADLGALLQSRQIGDAIPFLPLFNAAQVMHAQVQFLDFVNGEGVRFLTQYDQAPLPINNNELFYTFQGLTGDGKYYVSAVLPVTHPEIPESSQANDHLAEIMEDFESYLDEKTTLLDGQPADSFTPNLSILDATIQSIEVK